jgi:hypothetical protein
MAILDIQFMKKQKFLYTTIGGTFRPRLSLLLNGPMFSEQYLFLIQAHIMVFPAEVAILDFNIYYNGTC